MKKLFVLILSCIAIYGVHAQNYFSNDISYAGQGVVLTTLAVNNDGSFYASGYTKDYSTSALTPLIIKFDLNGGLLWQKTFPALAGGNIQDIKINHDGACVAVYKIATGFGTMKLTPAGDIAWSESYSEVTGMLNSDPYTKFSLSITKNNQLFVNTNLNYLSRSAVFRISDDDGAGDGDGDGNGDEDGDGDNNDNGGDIDTVIVIDDSGSLGKLPTMCMTICDDDTSVIVVGKDNDDCFAFRVGMSGATLWSKVYDDNITSNYLRMKSITSMKDGNYAIVGLFSTIYASTYDKGMLTKIDKNGTVLWSKTYTVTDPTITLDFEKVFQTANGNMYIIGSVLNSTTFTYFPVVLQVDASGAVVNSMYISDRNIQSVRFPTACIDGSGDKNNLMFVSNYLPTSAVDPVSYINKTDNLDNLSCNKVSIAITATDYAFASVATRPLTGVNSTGLTIDVTAGPTGSTNFDVSSTSNCKLGHFEEANAINEIASVQVSVYPNPTSDMLTFELNNATNASVKIYDLKGNLVYAAGLDKSTISLNALSAGLYNYIVTSNEGISKGKFVKN